MLDERQHPDSQQLAAFNLGQLDSEAAVAIEKHVGQCQPCCETLLELAAEDTFVGLLRDATPAPGEETLAIPAPLTRHPRYEIAGLIARGGMGDVFKAEHRVMERTVALKIIRPQLVRNAEAVARFHREVKTAAQLSHPNIVAAYDADRSGDVHFLVMEYVEGTNLADLVTRRGRLPVGEACDYIRQAAIGLQYAHERGMVHRDIKPHNLMVAGGRVKILDFGLASLAAAWDGADAAEDPAEQQTNGAGASPEAESRLTYAGAILGTPDFLSPEQCRDAGSADIRSDIYSLGCTLYYLLAGRAPFPENTVLEKLRAHEERDPEPLPDDVPTALGEVVRRMMAKDPAQRYRSPSEVAEALAPFADQDFRPKRPWGSRALKLAAALAAVLVLGVVLYLVTDTGTLVVQSPSDEVRLAILSDGEEVENVELRQGETRVRLRSGAYTIDLRGATAEFALANGADLTIRRSANTPIRIAARPDASAPTAPQQSETLLEIGRFEKRYGPVHGLAFSPDGQSLFVAARDDSLYQWDIAASRVVRHIPLPGMPTSLALLPDGRHAIVGFLAGDDVAMWNLDDGQLVRRFPGHTRRVDGLRVSPDGKRLLSGGQDSLVRLWDIESGAEIHSFEENFCAAVAMSRDGRTLAHAKGISIRIWDAESGETLRLIQRHGFIVTAAAFSPDGQRLVTADRKGRIQVWSVADGKEIYRFDGHREAVTDLVFTPDGHHFISGGNDKTMRFFDITRGIQVGVHQFETSCIRRLALSPDGQTLAGGGGVDRPPSDRDNGDYNVRLWRLPAELRQSETFSEVGRFEEPRNNIDSLAFSPDARFLFVGAAEKVIYQWDVESERVVREIPTDHYPRALAALPDGRHVIAADFEGRITMWSLDNGRVVRRFPGHTSIVRSIRVSPDGRRLLSGGDDGLVRLWDVNTGETIHSFSAGYCAAVAMSLDGRTLAHGKSGGGEFRIWDAESGKTLQLIERRANAVNALAFSPDGKLLVSGDGDGVIQVWKVGDGRQVYRFGGHERTVTSLVFTPDGRHFISGGYDKTMRLFDVSRGLEVAAREFETLCVTQLAISPDGRLLASGGGMLQSEYIDGEWTGPQRDGDYTVRLWRLPQRVTRSNDVRDEGVHR